jgi:opacity protein-like surface antigen
MSPGGNDFSKRSFGPAILVAMAMGLALTVIPATESGAEWRPRIVREGTLSLGLMAQGGAIVGGKEFSNDFDLGLGIGVPLRYRIGRESSLGITFAAQRYDAKVKGTELTDPKYLTALTTTLEYYQYFRVRRRSPRYLFLGVGLLQSRRKLESGETDFPGDGGVITLGGGTEIWWKRTFAFDLMLRYSGYIKNFEGSTDVTHTLQLGLGFQFYTSK